MAKDSLLCITIFNGPILPLPGMALTVSHPVNAYSPGRARHTSSAMPVMSANLVRVVDPHFKKTWAWNGLSKVKT